MMDSTGLPQPHTKPGVATAEDGLVILDGPDSLAITMTADAALVMARSLISAAEIAKSQAKKDPKEQDI